MVPHDAGLGSSVTRLVNVNVHTGLGPYGVDSLLADTRRVVGGERGKLAMIRALCAIDAFFGGEPRGGAPEAFSITFQIDICPVGFGIFECGDF